MARSTKPIHRDDDDDDDDSPKAKKAQAKRRVDDDDDEPTRPAKAARKAVPSDDNDDDDDDAPVSPRAKRAKSEEAPKRSMVPLIVLGGFGLLVLLGGVFAAGLFVAGVFSSGKEVVVSTGAPAVSPPPSVPGNTTPDAINPQPSPGESPVKPAPSTASPPSSSPPTTAPVKPTTPTAKPMDPPPSIKPKINKSEPSTPGPRTALSNATRERLKAATVYFECTGSNGTDRWTGSGWFGLEPNLIWTNAHVMGMDTPGGKPPSKITVYLNPGTPQQRAIPHARLELLAVDRERDLALLRVNGEKDLPPPMDIRMSSELGETDPLVILGYPGGAKLSSITGNTKQPSVTVNQSSVGSIRRDDFGNISAVQFNGGSAPGGSGGPIVDLDGNVVGVVYMGPSDAVLASSAAFGVPTEYVQGLFAGRVAEVEYGQPYRSNGMIRLPVTVRALDPFNRIKQIGIGFWVADANSKVRPPGQERKDIDPSDSNYKEVVLTYKHTKEKQTATGELEFPELQSGRVYMAQPFYSNGLVEKYYLAGNIIKLIGPPVDREPADLIARLRANAGASRLVTVSDESSLMEFEEGEGADKKQRVLRKTELKAYETVLNPQDQAAIATLRLQFDSLNLKMRLPLLGIEQDLPANIRKLLNDNIKKIQGFAHVGKDGQVYKTYTDIRGAGMLGPAFQTLTNSAMTALNHASVPLPNKRMNPSETWKYSRDEVMYLTYVSDLDEDPQAVPPPGGGRPPATGPKKKASRTRELKYRIDATYTYLGTRVRAGQKEAVVRVEAVIIPAAGARADTASGQIKGYVSVDADSGVVLEADLEREFELDTSEAGIKKRISGIENTKLSRGTAIRN